MNSKPSHPKSSPSPSRSCDSAPLPVDPAAIVARGRAITEIVDRVLQAKCARIPKENRAHMVRLLTATDYTIEEIDRAAHQLARTETSRGATCIAWEYWSAAFAEPTFTLAEVERREKRAHREGVLAERATSTSSATLPAQAFTERREGLTEWEWLKKAKRLDDELMKAVALIAERDETIKELERAIAELASHQSHSEAA